MEGMSQDAEDLGHLAVGYERVGLTWWIEKLGWWRGPVEEALRRIRAGPPG